MKDEPAVTSDDGERQLDTEDYSGQLCETNFDTIQTRELQRRSDLEDDGNSKYTNIDKEKCGNTLKASSSKDV